MRDATVSSRLPGFHKLSLEERLQLLSERLGIEPGALEPLLTCGLLSMQTADQMIENVIGRFDLPLGLGLNFTINGRDYIVPMAIEEPSVIAAVSFAAKLARAGGGFEATADAPLMVGQIQLARYGDPQLARERLLSNLADQRLARATCRIPITALEADGLSGEEVAEGILQANRFALVDPYRAATHNKGIMNGVDAVALTTGQDWRGIEAGAHAFAARSGHYRPLSTWAVEDSTLVGRVELPLALGMVGGPVQVHPGVQLALRILGVDTAQDLACVIASVGLAQNLSAVRALGSIGIQRGHMAMHARSVAVTAGATGLEVAQVAQALVESKNVKVDAAARILVRLRGTPT